MEESPGRFWKGDTNWINNYFVLVVSVRFSINRSVRSRLIEGELNYKSFPQVVRSKGSKNEYTVYAEYHTIFFIPTYSAS